MKHRRYRSLAIRTTILAFLVALVPNMASGQLTLARSKTWFSPFNQPAHFGHQLLAVDLNGDGLGDIVAGTPLANDGLPDYGRVDMRRTELDHSIPFVGTEDRCLNPADQGQGFRLGETLAAGDFDGDGDQDLAFGMPGASTGGTANAGAVCVLYREAGSVVARHRIAQGSWVSGFPQSGDSFGAALAVGDLNGDGIDDLAIAAPGDRFLTLDNAGSVHVVFGGAGGLQLAGDLLITRGLPGTWARAENESFGWALAIGDFHGDASRLELAIGAPGDHPDAIGGSVTVVRADQAFPQFERHLWVKGEGSDLLGNGSEGDHFGFALAPGDFDGDGDTDLAVGVPGESGFGLMTESGTVMVLYRNATELSDLGEVVLSESSFGGTLSNYDWFGEVLVPGDFNGDGRTDLAIGMPSDNPLGISDAGKVIVAYGTGVGLLASGHQVVAMNFFGGLTAGDRFGWALATGKLFDRHGGDDLIIGVPGLHGSIFDQPPEPNVGRVFVVQSALFFADGFESGDTSAWSTP